LGDLAVHEVLRFEARALGGDLDLEPVGVEEGDRTDPTLVGQERTPERFPANADGADYPDPGDVSSWAVVLHLALH
jgi:hypothetical protein